MTAEQAVLGSMLVAQDAADEGLDTLQPQYFQGHVEAAIFRAMQRCREQHKAIDLVTVQAALQETGVLDEVGGIPYLVELGQMVPTAANIASYAKQVREEYSRRQIVQGMTALLTKAATTDPQELAAEIAMLAQQVDSGDIQDDSMKAIAMEEFEAIGRRADGRDTPIDTGLSRLDAIIGGMTKGEMWVIGARPSVGKSALAFQIAQNVVDKGHKAIFFSAEMSRSMLAQRLFASVGVPIHVMRRPQGMDEQDAEKLAIGMALAQRLEQLYVDTRDSSIPEIRARCRHMQAHGGLDLVVVDYLQILRAAGRTESRNLEVASISADLKRLAKDLDVPVVVLSQLSRAGAYGEKPSLIHLRDSGSIEQDADVAILMYRLEGEEFDEAYGPVQAWLAEQGNSIVRMDIAKNRNGPLGSADYMLDGRKVRFTPPVTFIEDDRQEELI